MYEGLTNCSCLRHYIAVTRGQGETLHANTSRGTCTLTQTRINIQPPCTAPMTVSPQQRQCFCLCHCEIKCLCYGTRLCSQSTVACIVSCSPCHPETHMRPQSGRCCSRSDGPRSAGELNLKLLRQRLRLLVHKIISHMIYRIHHCRDISKNVDQLKTLLRSLTARIV